MKACMGGNCLAREGCANYNAIDRRRPAERLCEKGRDYPAPMRTMPVVIRYPLWRREALPLTQEAA